MTGGGAAFAVRRERLTGAQWVRYWGTLGWRWSWGLETARTLNLAILAALAAVTAAAAGMGTSAGAVVTMLAVAAVCAAFALALPAAIGVGEWATHAARRTGGYWWVQDERGWAAATTYRDGAGREVITGGVAAPVRRGLGGDLGECIARDADARGLVLRARARTPWLQRSYAASGFDVAQPGARPWMQRPPRGRS